MTPEDKLRDYLWDPAAPADPEVEGVEARLSALRFDPAANPLRVPRARPAWKHPVAVLALAASLLLAAGSGALAWRWSWPEGRPWTLQADGTRGHLEVGRPVTVPAGQPALARIARIGTMRVAAGTSIELRATRGTRHRLRMTEGDIHVRVWAPPVSVVIETPAGEVIDMGCEFVLSVSGGVSSVRVASGWVQMENGIDEVLIPAGASSEMAADSGPGVPVYDDARDGFRDAVRGVEAGAGSDALERVLELARARDVYTLLQLADRHPKPAEQLLRRAAEMWPPPGDVTIGGILRGDRQALWRWVNSLPLPSPKSGWWKNWRDALPR
jgi:hypothetical protein